MTPQPLSAGEDYSRRFNKTGWRKHGYSKAPIFLDLDGDGFELTQNYVFDYDSDGEREHGAWLADEADAVLAVDYDFDGQVTHGYEIAFADWHEDAQTVLQGLQLAFDSNQDGLLNESDEHWSQFGIWIDRNQNGISEAGEFKSLSEAGIKEFDLSSDGQHQQLDGATDLWHWKFHLRRWFNRSILPTVLLTI